MCLERSDAVQRRTVRHVEGIVARTAMMVEWCGLWSTCVNERGAFLEVCSFDGGGERIRVMKQVGLVIRRVKKGGIEVLN